jgi:[histone H3]-lysine79 N-trimethyltransferase
MFTNKKRLEIKKQTISVPAKPASRNSSLFARNHSFGKSSPLPVPAHARSGSSSKLKPRPSPKNTPSPSDHRPSPATPQSAKRKRATNAAPDFGTDSGSEDGDADAERTRELDAKRRKQREVRALYKDRRVRSQAAFEPKESERVKVPIIHAAEIPSRDRGTRYEPYFAGLEEGWMIELQYPSLCERER